MQHAVLACHGITGDVLDRVPVTAFTYDRLLSARGDGSATIPLASPWRDLDFRGLTRPWERMLALVRGNRVAYAGYIIGREYDLGSPLLHVQLGDLWALLEKRLAVDHSINGVEKWQVTITASLATHANVALIWARDSYTGMPSAMFPVTIPGHADAPAVTRTYYGYHLQTVADMFAELVAEGLEIYLEPRLSEQGKVYWYVRAGIGWTSGLSRDIYVSTPTSPVTALKWREDAARVTNNAIRVGEGSEQDMLTRSNVNPSSPLPLLERVTASKTVADSVQLQALTIQDLKTFGSPTEQWDVTVTADTQIDIGDTARMHVDRDWWIPSGWHSRQAVRISGDLSEQMRVAFQPTGGA